jgi:N-acetylneuraminate synthase/N,N'-diacetyllegionaminate synthase
MKKVQLGHREIGPGQSCLVVAEAGVNHNGDVELARQLVDAAADARADAVKFQMFFADNVAVAAAAKVGYQRRFAGDAESQRDMLRQLELSGDDFRAIRDHCGKRDILFLSSPFDRVSADLLADLDVPAFKVGSGELTNHPLLAYIASKEKPVILSTGMSNQDEVSAAVDVVRQGGCGQIVLLHCVSCYPADIETCNLRAIATLRDRFDVPVGFSDHTIGNEAALAAVALGASVIEKHLTLGKEMYGPDHKASCEPGELNLLIQEIRTVERALGDGVKQPLACEAEIRRLARRSLVVVDDVAQGQAIEERHLSAKRPADGICPSELRKVAGRQAARALPVGTVLRWSDLV